MLKIKIINKSTNPLPKYQTEGSSGLDLHANLDKPITLNKNDIVLVPTGLFIEIPDGYEAQIRSRSSLALKNGIFSSCSFSNNLFVLSFPLKEKAEAFSPNASCKSVSRNFWYWAEALMLSPLKSMYLMGLFAQ